MNREKILNDTVKKISEILVDEPNAMNLVLDHKDGVSFYRWELQSPKAKKIRGAARRILSKMWQAGDFSFGEIAQKLRLQALDVQALLDEQFRQKHGIR